MAFGQISLFKATQSSIIVSYLSYSKYTNVKNVITNVQVISTTAQPRKFVSLTRGPAPCADCTFSYLVLNDVTREAVHYR